MQKILLFSALLLTLQISAQNFSFQTLTETYVPLNNATLVSDDLVWDEPVIEIPLGFNFSIGNTTFSTVYMYEATLTNTLVDEGSTGQIPVLFPFATDIVDRAYNGDNEDMPGGVSPIRYRVDGLAGSRIAKIEFANVGFWEETFLNGTTVDFANFQIWLYETTNVVEFRYGPSSISLPQYAFMDETGPYVAAISSLDLLTETATGMELVGPANAPNTQSIEFIIENFIEGMPSNGRVYRFSPTLSNPTVTAQNISISPNPASDFVYISLGQESNVIEHVTVYNSIGQKVPVSLNSNAISVDSLPKGLYIIEISSGNHMVSTKFIKN